MYVALGQTALKKNDHAISPRIDSQLKFFLSTFAPLQKQALGNPSQIKWMVSISCVLFSNINETT